MRSLVRGVLAGVVLMTVFGATAAPRKSRSFDKVPPAAVEALRTTTLKKISTGYVFISGRYLPPPYTIERYGTVLRINGEQVTSEVVPWSEFVKTQAGATPKSVEAEPEPAEPEPATPEAADPEENDDEVSLDDLFDDDAAPAKPVAKKSATPRPVARPKPAAKPVVEYTFTGEFTPNEQTQAYLKKIDGAVLQISKVLKSDGYYFFSPVYRKCSSNEAKVKYEIGKLVEISKTSTSFERFDSAVRTAGLFVGAKSQLFVDLFKNRYGYSQLKQR